MGADPARDHPAAWKKIAALQDVVLLRMAKGVDGRWASARGDQSIAVSEAGLERI
jgi:hypothetical protein